ncbi:MAG: oligosaccharide flippase family protein [Armatimonadota bacterium]|nr:oligosaccharide flippase family protein [Armatimonadota bacterium]
MSSLRRTAVKGFLWQVFGLFGQRGAAFIASIVLARLLAPDDFGVVAVALAIVTFAELLRAGGLVPAFIAHQGKEDDAASTVFWLSLLAGFGFFLVMFFGAPFAANWFDAPRLTPILRALAVTQIIDSFRTVPFAILVRDYRFREKSIADSAPMLIAVPAGIISGIMLPQDQKAWALVIMYLIRYVLSTGLVWKYEPQRITWTFNKALARTLTAEGRRILGSIIPSTAIDPITRLALGSRVDLGSVGVFNLASAVTTPPTFLAYAANWTLYPIISNNLDDPKRIERYLVRSLKSVGLLSLGVLAWLALVAPDLLPIVFGEKWIALVVPTQWLCLATAFRNYALLATNALMAYKKSKPAIVIWWVALIVVSLLLVFWPLPANSAVVPSQLVAFGLGVAWVLSIILTARSFHLSAGDVADTILIPTVPSLLAAGATYGLRQAVGEQLSPGGRVLVETIAFLAVFLPVSGKMLGGGWMSLFTPKGVKAVIRGPKPDAV